jgi:succinoglycan biosynthesis transport protein ExoP
MRKSKFYTPPAKRRKAPPEPEVSQIPASTLPTMRASVADGDTGLGELFNIVYRRIWLIVGVVAGAVVLAAVGLQFVTPRYQAQTLLLMEPQQISIPTVDSILAGRTADDQGVRSQVEVLRSRGLAAATIDHLGLDQDAEFNSRLKPPGLLRSLLGTSDSSGAEKKNQTAVVDSFLRRLDVEAVKNSRVLSVVFTSVEADKAASISNSLADQYLVAQLETKFDATRMANSWLNDRVSELREQVAQSETAVEDFRRNAGLLQTEGGTLTAQQIVDLNGQLILARAAEAEAEARLEQLSSLINSPGGVASASEVLDSATIQRLKAEQSDVEGRVAELSAEYGPSHPRMIQLNAEADDVLEKIDAEVNKVVRNLSNELAIAKARETSLERELGRMKEVMSLSNDKQIQLRALEREAEANRALLATLLARYKEISSQDEMKPQQADARIISRADAPTDPSFPNKAFTLGIVVPISAMFALILVFTTEGLQRGYVSGRQIEDETGVTSLGFVPLLSPRQSKIRDPLEFVLERPRSALAQSLRTAFWSLSLTTPAGLNIVVVTSSHPGEGKTTIALGLARTQAKSGQKTLLIDADTRNPSVHEVLDAPRSPGLIEVLNGEADAPMIVNFDGTGLDYITAGEAIEDPLPLLDSKAMDNLLTRMSKSYDLVIIDTPPVMAALDACALSRKADATVLVVRWSKTRRAVVSHTLGELARAKGHLAGALLNMVDVEKHSKYLYGDSGAYHGTLRKYYSESE